MIKQIWYLYITDSYKSLNNTQWYIISLPLTRLYLLLKHPFGEQKYSRKLWVLSLLIHMIKYPPMVHASEQLMTWNLQTPHPFLWGALWGGLREPGDFSFLQFLMLALTDGKRLCWVEGGFPALLTWLLQERISLSCAMDFPCVFPETSPLPQFHTLYLFSRDLFLTLSGPDSQKHQDGNDKKSWKRVALILVSLGTFFVEIRE